VSQNIQNLPPNSPSEKSYRVAAQATGGDSSDLRMWQEIGLCWPRLPKTDNCYARTKGKPDRLCSQWAYNVHDPPDLDPYQAGRTAVITSKRLTPWITSHDADPSGLGCWAWTRIGNKPLRCTTFISVYRPCRQTSKGISTAQAQHRRSMPTNDLDPRQVLLDDLRGFILQQQEKGDIIIVDIDAKNEDVCGRTIKQFFAALSIRREKEQLSKL
jgi:hypothetical protein